MSGKEKMSAVGFCLESKIRHSTIFCSCVPFMSSFCLESKIRHSTIRELVTSTVDEFCLESKIRHSTIDFSNILTRQCFALNPK